MNLWCEKNAKSLRQLSLLLFVGNLMLPSKAKSCGKWQAILDLPCVHLCTFFLSFSISFFISFSLLFSFLRFSNFLSSIFIPSFFYYVLSFLLHTSFLQSLCILSFAPTFFLSFFRFSFYLLFLDCLYSFPLFLSLHT